MAITMLLLLGILFNVSITEQALIDTSLITSNNTLPADQNMKIKCEVDSDCTSFDKSKCDESLKTCVECIDNVSKNALSKDCKHITGKPWCKHLNLANKNICVECKDGDHCKPPFNEIPDWYIINQPPFYYKGGKWTCSILGTNFECGRTLTCTGYYWNTDGAGTIDSGPGLIIDIQDPLYGDIMRSAHFHMSRRVPTPLLPETVNYPYNTGVSTDSVQIKSWEKEIAKCKAAVDASKYTWTSGGKDSDFFPTSGTGTNKNKKVYTTWKAENYP